MSGKSKYRADSAANHKYYLHRKAKVAFIKLELPHELKDALTALSKGKNISRTRLVIRYLKFGIVNDKRIEDKRNNAYGIQKQVRELEKLAHPSTVKGEQI